MNKALNNAGIPDTPKNNSMIIGNILDSAKDASLANRHTSRVIIGKNGSVRVLATWAILPDRDQTFINSTHRGANKWK